MQIMQLHLLFMYFNIKAFVLKDHRNLVKKVLLHNTVQIPTLRLTLTVTIIAAGLMATGC